MAVMSAASSLAAYLNMGHEEKLLQASKSSVRKERNTVVELRRRGNLKSERGMDMVVG
ncbi:hypothetical protein COLO4_26183 [Corchorus olitorius]|uniref:Uncharacterized protein n=1 Tax=Corchorus olitorius TaxID=93759 RepID=A0A1R3HYC4_9ROSI|nr:hypothetical protein COLO4_26183 [Corchorus olitorius]